MNRKTKPIDIKLVKFYLWLGLGFYFFGLFNTLSTYPDRFVASAFNNLWGALYLIPVNFILFEYTVPFVLKKRRLILYNILLGILFLFVHMMLYSYGSYAWRLLGIQLHIYTAMRSFPDLDHALENQMAYSTGSVFIF